MATQGSRVQVRTGGVVLVIIGVALTVLSFTQLPWYLVDAGTDSAGNGFLFSDLRGNADKLDTSVAIAYFDWVALTLAIALAMVGIAACVSWPGANLMRILGFLLGLLGVVGTFYALAQLFAAQRAAGGSNHSVVHNSTIGLWTAVVGYAIAGLVAARGPRGG